MNAVITTPVSQSEEHLVNDEIAVTPQRTIRVLHVLPELYPGGMERTMLRIIKAIEVNPPDSTGPHIEHGFCILKDADVLMLRQCESLGWVRVMGQADASRCLSVGRFAFGRLAEIIQRLRPDVVHARSTSAWVDAVLAVKRSSLCHRARLLLSYHGRTSAAPESLWQTMRQAPRRWAARQADAVMAVSGSIAEMLERRWGLGPERICVLPNGVDVQMYHPPKSVETRKALRAQLGIPESARMILCVANYVPIKNHELLINAYRQVALARPEAHLYLLGQGPCEPALRYLANDMREKGRHQRIHFAGNRDDVALWLRAADVFALPSLSEGCSNAVLEAMASGLPVAVSDIPGNCEIIQHGDTGALLPLNDSQAWARRISSWLDDPADARQFGRAARAHAVERYSLQRTATRYIRLYAALATASVIREVSPCAV